MINQTTPSKIVTGALLAALSCVAGCKQEPLCAELGNCGGPTPLGIWELTPTFGASCSEDLYTPPADTRLIGADLPPARNPPPEPALYDWCYLLVTSGGTSIQAKPPQFFYESGHIGGASIKYEADGHYSAGITRTGTFLFDFPAYCMRAFGGMDGRPAVPGGEPTNVCKQLEVPLRDAGIGEGAYRNTTCEPNPEDPQGCLCAFDVTETGGSAGTYTVLSDGTILHLPNTNFPQKVSYCNKGTSLELTGANGEYLFGVRGLRTLNLAATAPVQ